MSEELDQIFGQLVTRSWQRYDELKTTREIDDLLVGAVMTAMISEGNKLIDLTSDGNNHYLRFEHPQNKQRLIFQLAHQSGNVIAARTLGHHASVTMGYGEFVPNARSVWQALKSEVKSNFLDTKEPGVMTVDADMSTSYVYVQMELILDLTPYFGDNYTIQYPLLQQHLAAVRQALAKYLRGRLAN